MNPENNNPLSNPFAAGGTNTTSDKTSMSDSLASAQDNLTSAGMAAGPAAGGAIGLDQIAASDSGSSVPSFADEPLVPAAPVPGSIGSAISMPAAEPIAAPSFGAMNSVPSAPSAPYADPNAAYANPAQNFNAMPAPEAASAQVPAQPAVPYNPFSAPVSDAQGASVNYGPTDPVAPAQPDFAAQPATAVDPAHAAPAVQPMPLGNTTSNSSKSINPLVIVFGVISGILLILAITFFILWNNEKKNLKPVYYPQVSNSTNSALKSISCQRAENYQNADNPSGSGKSVITMSFSGDKLSAYASNLSLDFASAEEATKVRDTSASLTPSLAEIAGTSFMSDYLANGNNYTHTVTSRDGVEIVTADAQNVIYGTTEGNPSLALADLQAKYESEGYVCTEE